MLPLHDDNPSGRTPWVTYGLIAANVLVFLYQLTMSDAMLERFVYAFGVVPHDMTARYGMVSGGHAVALTGFVPLLTSLFMHAGWMHLGGNMLFLYIFGDNIEDRLGHLGYALFYLLAGVAASLAHVLSDPASELPSLGASGAIGGVLGAYVVLYPAARVTTLTFLGPFITTLRIPAWIFLGIWFALQSLNGVASLGNQPAGGVAWFAHIGGFLAGVLVGVLAKALPERDNGRSPHADRWYSERW